MNIDFKQQLLKYGAISFKTINIIDNSEFIIEISSKDYESLMENKTLCDVLIEKYIEILDLRGNVT